MDKIFSFLILPIFWFSALPDCTADFSWTSTKDPNGNYSIELTLNKGEGGQYNLELYDLNVDRVINSKKEYFTSGERKVIFEKIKPSTYTVIFSSSTCSKKVIKGKGIVLE